MWPAMDLGNRGVFMKLGKFETKGGSSRDGRCEKWSGNREKGREK